MNDTLANDICQKNYDVYNFKVLGMDKVSRNTIHRKFKESFWIKENSTFESQKLNTYLERHWQFSVKSMPYLLII